MRAREPDPLDAGDGVARAEKLTELRADRRREVAPPRVHVLPEEGDLADAARVRAASTSATISPGRRLCSRPRTAGTMQYAHAELQPIETCTHAWKRRSPRSGRSAAKCSCVPNRPRGTRVSARRDPLAEVRDRARAESDVDERILLEDPLPLRLGVAPADRDDDVRPLALQRTGVAEVRGEPRVRLLADRAGVEDEDVGVVGATSPHRARATRAFP